MVMIVVGIEMIFIYDRESKIVWRLQNIVNWKGLEIYHNYVGGNSGEGNEPSSVNWAIRVWGFISIPFSIPIAVYKHKMNINRR